MKIRICRYHLLIIFLSIYSIFAKSLGLASLNIVFIIIFSIYILFIEKSLTMFYSMILFLIPNINLFLYNGIPLINILIAISLIYLFWTNKIYLERKELSFLKIIICFIIYDFIHFIFNDYYNIMEISILYLCIISAFFFFIYLKRNKYILEKCISFFLAGTVVSLTSGLLYMVINGILSSDISIVNRNIGNAGDPNYLGLYILLSISFLINKIKKQGMTLKSTLIIVFLAIGGFSTSSRTYLIILLIEILVFIFIILKLVINNNKIKNLILIAVGIIIVINLLSIFRNNIDFIFQRFTNSKDINELTNGRSGLNMYYLNVLYKNPFRLCFGFGISKYPINMNIYEYAHNGYIEILVSEGVLGAILILAILIYYGMKKNNSIFTIRGLPLLVFCGIAIGINIVEVESFYYIIALLLSNTNPEVLSQYKKSVVKVNENKSDRKYLQCSKK